MIVARGVIPEPVEADLPHPHRFRMVLQSADLSHGAFLDSSGLVRVDAENREDADVLLGELEGAAAVVDVCADGEDPRDARLGGTLDRLVGIVEGGEVGMRVDHGSSAARTASASSLRKSGRGSRSVWPGGSSLGAQEPTQLA